MGMEPLTIALGVATGLGNLFGNQSANNQREEALSRYRKRLIEAKYDPVEKARAIDRVGDAYNTEIANQLNNSAFGLGRFLNSSTAKAVSASKLLGQRSGAIVNESGRIDEYNKKIDVALAESELQGPVSDSLGDFISGAAGGVQLGMAIGNYNDQLSWSRYLRKKIKSKGGLAGTTLGDSVAPAGGSVPVYGDEMKDMG